MVQRAPTPKPAPTAESVGRMRSIHAPNPKPQNNANKDCPQALRAPTEPQTDKRPEKTQNPAPLENRPDKSYKPSSDADESDPEPSQKC